MRDVVIPEEGCKEEIEMDLGGFSVCKDHGYRLECVILLRQR